MQETLSESFHGLHFSLMGLLLLHSVFFALLTLSTSVPPDSNASQKYIIQMRNDLKPLVFSDAEYWYKSTLSTLTSDTFESKSSKAANLLHVYKTVFHGFVAELLPQHAEKFRMRQEVLGVYPNQMLQLHTTRSTQFLGLTGHGGVPDASDLLNVSNYGSNVVIGFLDTGIWPESRSYNDDDLEPIPSHWKGECIEGDSFTKNHCNKKLVGARYFAEGVSPTQMIGYNSARDSDGHGTHTSSTAAGSRVSNASLFGYAQGTATGIAPKARVAVYKTCWTSGCTTVDVVAAYDKALEDGVDIISFSIGGNHALTYYEDPIAIAQFTAMERNIFVSASAGNSGPYAGVLANIPPWITTVGAGTIDRRFPADLVLENGHVINGISLYSGPWLSQKAFSPLVYANGNDEYPCMPGSLDSASVKGKIVVCTRGNVPRSLQGEVVRNASGVAMVLANTVEDGDSLLIDPHVLPVIAITSSDHFQLFSYINSTEIPRAKIVFQGTEINVKPAPLVAGFSSRGPNQESKYIIKPDLIAPGGHILAAWPNSASPSRLDSDNRRVEFNILSGTSMSCPHISGVAALLKAAHPSWPTARIKSAMMTTSYVVDNKGNQLNDEFNNNVSTPWDYGSGHVDPQKAIDPGLVYDLTVDDYIDFLCASNYSENEIGIITGRSISCKKGLKPWNINYPSISVAFVQSEALKYEVSLTRTVTQVSEGASSYRIRIENPVGVTMTVSPSRLDFSQKDQKLSYAVKITAGQVDFSSKKSITVFGRLRWEDGKHVVSMPIAVTFSSL